MPTNYSKPFPWKCGQCGKKGVARSTVSYSLQIEHDGRTYDVTVPDLEAPRCQECGEIVLDDIANRRISDVFRRQLGLLTPEQIRRNREAMGKTQKQLAGMLAIAEATLSRWETGGQIQQRALDRLMRLFFALPEVRVALADEATLSELGSSVAAASKSETDIRRETRLSRLSAALRELPASKEEAAVDEFHRLVALIGSPETR